MRIVFEFDTDDLNGNKEKKLTEFREVEKILLDEIRKIDQQSKEKIYSAHYRWFRSLPDRPF